jgi:heat shock protein beta
MACYVSLCLGFRSDGEVQSILDSFWVGLVQVTVSTKSAKSDKQYVWEGEADTSVYSIREETDSDKLLPRGTVITLHLKADDKFEYADAVRIQNLVKNYSQFISFPIYTWQEKSQTKEV